MTTMMTRATQEWPECVHHCGNNFGATQNTNNDKTFLYQWVLFPVKHFLNNDHNNSNHHQYLHQCLPSHPVTICDTLNNCYIISVGWTRQVTLLLRNIRPHCSLGVICWSLVSSRSWQLRRILFRVPWNYNTKGNRITSNSFPFKWNVKSEFEKGFAREKLSNPIFEFCKDDDDDVSSIQRLICGESLRKVFPELRWNWFADISSSKIASQ